MHTFLSCQACSGKQLQLAWLQLSVQCTVPEPMPGAVHKATSTVQTKLDKSEVDGRSARGQLVAVLMRSIIWRALESAAAGAGVGVATESGVDNSPLPHPPHTR